MAGGKIIPVLDYEIRRARAAGRDDIVLLIANVIAPLQQTVALQRAQIIKLRQDVDALQHRGGG